MWSNLAKVMSQDFVYAWHQVNNLLYSAMNSENIFVRPTKIFYQSLHLIWKKCFFLKIFFFYLGISAIVHTLLYEPNCVTVKKKVSLLGRLWYY